MSNNKKLIKKILACSVGLSTSLCASPLSSYAMNKVENTTQVSDTTSSDMKSQLKDEINQSLNNANIDEIKKDLNSGNISKKNRAVATVLGLAPDIQKLYLGKYGKFFGVIGLYILISGTLISFGFPAGIACWIAYGGLAGYNTLKYALGYGKDSKGRAVKNW